MKKVLDGELQLQVYTYSTDDERDKHIEEMESLGWTCKQSGVALLSPDSNMVDYLNESLWEPYAEFYKKEELVQIKDPITYESSLYWFDLYNTTIKKEKVQNG